ncbi:hypothetical protein ONS96_014866 [Cadophora gregata f. sp. sojae]|nr:hypothetical protein ONS96_014866 [Cadophora gregata f. sp. sojae]
MLAGKGKYIKSGRRLAARLHTRGKRRNVKFRHRRKWTQALIASDSASEKNPLAHLDDATSATLLDEEEGQDAEFHMYQSRIDTRGERVVLQVGAKSDFENRRPPSHAAALILTRFYSESKKLVETTLAIRSPYLKKALREIIKYYPSEDLDSSADIELDDEPWLLFHYRKELKSYAMASNDRKVRDLIKLCLQYVSKKFRRELVFHENIKNNPDAIPTLEHRNLWIVYKPGDFMYQCIENHHTIRDLLLYIRLRAMDQ